MTVMRRIAFHTADKAQGAAPESHRRPSRFSPMLDSRRGDAPSWASCVGFPEISSSDRAHAGFYQILKQLPVIVDEGRTGERVAHWPYAIGVARPMGIFVDTYGTAKVKMTDGDIAKKIEQLFDMRPYAIEKRLKLRNPIYSETAAYGHMGREPKVVEKTFVNTDGKMKKVKVELFTWEKLDYVPKIRREFGLK